MVYTLSKLYNGIFDINCRWLDLWQPQKSLQPVSCLSKPSSHNTATATFTTKVTSLTSNLATIMRAIIACSVLTCANYNVLPWEGGGVAEPEGVYGVVTKQKDMWQFATCQTKDWTLKQMTDWPVLEEGVSQGDEILKAEEERRHHDHLRAT